MNCENQNLRFCGLAVSQGLPTGKRKKLPAESRCGSRRDEPEVWHVSRGPGWHWCSSSPLAAWREGLTVSVNVTLLT